MQYPGLLTSSGWAAGIINILLNNNDLTPARDNQIIHLKGGQGHRLLHKATIK